MKDFARIEIQREQPLTLEEMTRIATRLGPTEPFFLNNWSSKRIFSKGDCSSEDATVQRDTPTPDNSQSTQDASMSPETAYKDELPPEMVYHEGVVEDETKTTSTLIQLLPAHYEMMSSVQMVFGFGECEESRKNHYFSVKLYSRHDPDDKRSPVVVVAQHKYTTELFCGIVHLDSKLLTYSQEVLEELLAPHQEQHGVLKLKSKLPLDAGLKIFRASLEQMREKYGIR